MTRRRRRPRRRGRAGHEGPHPPRRRRGIRFAAGTTSNYFRTRAALVEAAVIDRLEERDLELWAADREAPPPLGPDALAERLAGYLAILAGDQADLTRARLALSLADPDAVAAGHARFMAVARGMVEASGIDDAERRARWVADYCDGVLLHHVTARRDEALDVSATAAAIRRLLT